MPRLSHIDLAIASSSASLLDPEGRANLAKKMAPHVTRAVKSTLSSIQKAQKSPIQTRKWSLDSLPYTAHFTKIVHDECEKAGFDFLSPAGLAFSNATYRTLVNTRKKGLLFKAAPKVVRKPRPTVKRVPPVLRKKTKRRA